ncbi:MAG: 50S ribosomal protein L6 [Chromatiales bacterium]|nr:50S ribosomal protein L6 [Chromatiales bacterium]
MSRIGKAPVNVPAGVDVTIDGSKVSIKGPKGSLEMPVHDSVEVRRDDGALTCGPRGDEASGWAMAGTTRALLANMVSGVSKGFERRLQLVGVGYRAQLQGSSLNLALGFSHPVSFDPPEGVTLEVPSQTEIVVRGIDKQKVGQTAAVIRAFRPPEPYKGKGIKYADEIIVRKEAKKK